MQIKHDQTKGTHRKIIYIHIYKLEITNRVFTKYYWSLGASKHTVPQMVYVTNIRNITSARILTILIHYDDVIMGAIASQIITLTIVYSTVYSGANQRKHQRSASLAFVRGIHRWPVNSPHKWPVTRKMFSFDDVILHQPFYAFVKDNCDGFVLVALSHKGVLSSMYVIDFDYQLSF